MIDSYEKVFVNNKLNIVKSAISKINDDMATKRYLIKFSLLLFWIFKLDIWYSLVKVYVCAITSVLYYFNNG